MMLLMKERLQGRSIGVSLTLSGSCRKRWLQRQRDRRLAQLTDELVLKGALLKQAKANSAGAKRSVGLVHADRLLAQTSLAKQRECCRTCGYASKA